MMAELYSGQEDQAMELISAYVKNYQPQKEKPQIQASLDPLNHQLSMLERTLQQFDGMPNNRSVQAAIIDVINKTLKFSASPSIRLHVPPELVQDLHDTIGEPEVFRRMYLGDWGDTLDGAHGK
jgi:hypothetical protein